MAKAVYACIDIDLCAVLALRPALLLRLPPPMSCLGRAGSVTGSTLQLSVAFCLPQTPEKGLGSKVPREDLGICF